jgi:hypothetical protein
MRFMHIKFSCSPHTRSNKSNIIYSIKSFNKRYLIRRRKRPGTTHGGLLPASPDILGALALHCLLAGLLLRLFLGLLLLLAGLLLLPFSVDISSKCLVILPSLLKFFLGYSQFLF